MPEDSSGTYAKSTWGCLKEALAYIQKDTNNQAHINIHESDNIQDNFADFGFGIQIRVINGSITVQFSTQLDSNIDLVKSEVIIFDNPLDAAKFAFEKLCSEQIQTAINAYLRNWESSNGT